MPDCLTPFCEFSLRFTLQPWKGVDRTGVVKLRWSCCAYGAHTSQSLCQRYFPASDPAMVSLSYV